MSKTTVAADWTPDLDELTKYLRAQRWFGDKSAVIRDARIVQRVRVSWPNAKRDFVVARVRVSLEQGDATYQLFLEPGEGLTDALTDPEFRRGLVDGFAVGATFEGGNARWIVESETEAPLVVPPRAEIRLVSAEQTNSSLIVDAAAILKLYRKLETGIHPDVEVTRFLTIERRFIHVPALLGTIRFEDARGEQTTAGMLQELVPGAQDGWEFALAESREYFAAGDWRGSTLPFQDEAKQLGAITRELHETLASGDRDSAFAMEQAGPEDIARWVDAAQQMFTRAWTSLGRAIADGRVAKDMLADAQSVADRRTESLKWIADLGTGIGFDAGAKARTHGDYHLGQVLRSTADRFLVIDFEGEPARPLAERRARHSPLRDVAGMLRSFSYAAAVSAAQSSKHAASIRSARWERSTRDAFLAGYFAETKGRHGLLPQAQTNAERLIALFEAEKVFYELQYELDHRPDWVWVPLAGIAKLYT